ncbi:MAG TPA: dTMP kinase [Armatimonadetes bacterium]|nr:dTMP kinase [Armatimonadota bacterium]
MRGLFITLEGPDGAGKSTQEHLLCAYLTRRGRRVVRTREPGGTWVGDLIRDLLLSPAEEVETSTCQHPAPTLPAYGEGKGEVQGRVLHARTELLLYLAARAQHVEECIRPALEGGCDVVCSRFSDSTLAYQGGGLGLDETVIRALDAFATQGLKPDVTFVFDLPAAEGLARVRQQRTGAGETLDRIEARSLAYHERVRQTFLRLAAAEPDRVRVLDARLPVEELHAAVVAHLEPLLQRWEEAEGNS